VTRSRTESYYQSTRALNHGYHRVCHDCGKPCHDYRCAECWRKLRAEDDYYMAPHSGQADSMEVAGI